MDTPLGFLFDLGLELFGDVFVGVELIDLQVIVYIDLFVNIDEGEFVVTKTWDPVWNSIGKLGGGGRADVHMSLHPFVGVDKGNRIKRVALGNSLGGLSSEQLVVDRESDACALVSAENFLSKLWICNVVADGGGSGRAFDQVQGLGGVSKVYVELGNIFGGVVEQEVGVEDSLSSRTMW